MNIDLLASFPGAKKEGRGWSARCPAHDDHRASLSISTGETQPWLVKCHAGCSTEDIVTAAGLTMADLMKPHQDGTRKASISAVYRYYDEQGTHLYNVVRFDHPKDFRQQRADGVWSMEGVRRVLYQLPGLQGKSVVYAVEGERDADRLRAKGIDATTSPGGACKWKPEFTDQLKNAGVQQVVILPDADDPGRRHAQQVAESCHASGLHVKVVELPGLPEAGDVSDWLTAGHTTAELFALVEASAPYAGVVVTAPTAIAEPQENLPADQWPQPLDERAFHGVIGELVRLVEPHTEADPAALLVQALSMLGNIVGPLPHCFAGGARHAMVINAVLVGLTSKGRKGTSYNSIATPLSTVDETLRDADRVVSGLSSGEGLIWSVRDPVMKGTDVVDPGIADKRKLVVEGEFASVLKNMMREGNILSSVVRQTWDSGTLGTLTKTNQAKATDAHISIIGHVTGDELRRYLSATEAGNGFGNRFLWVCTKRSKLLPEGGELHRVDFGPIVRQLRAVVDFARQVGELQRDGEAKAFWAEIYADLSEGQRGMFGAMTSRAEAQVMRLSCLYAIADLSPMVTKDHLQAALSVWRYCEDSARFIFGSSLGDPVADELDQALARAGHEGLTRTSIRDLFGRNRSSNDVSRALTLLLEHGRVNRAEDRSQPGRPVERWTHISYDINDKSRSGKVRGGGYVVGRNADAEKNPSSTNDINDITPSYGDSDQLRHTTKVDTATQEDSWTI